MTTTEILELTLKLWPVVVPVILVACMVIGRYRDQVRINRRKQGRQGGRNR